MGKEITVLPVLAGTAAPPKKVKERKNVLPRVSSAARKRMVKFTPTEPDAVMCQKREREKTKEIHNYTSMAVR